jgi:hypothetical protein
MKSLSEHLKLYLRTVLACAGAFPTKLTAQERVAELISRLSPVIAPKELIRLGPNGDGGYLLPDDLDGVHACFSPGVSLISGFERDCAERGMKVFLADGSVEGPAEKHDLFKFTKKFIGVTANAEFVTLDQWVADSVADSSADLLLQMDIEGYEYEVLLSASQSLMNRCRIIVAEFHSLELLWSEPFFNLAGRVFDKILQSHSCVHLHPNNHHGSVKRGGIEIPRIMEFTFLRNDRMGPRRQQAIFPHPLDCDNTDNATVVLPKCWYSAV